MLVRESISFERKKDPKKALGLDPYVGAILRIPDNYIRNVYDRLYRRFNDVKNRQKSQDFEVVKAEIMSDDSIKVDLKYTFSDGRVSFDTDLLLTPKQFEKFRYIK